MVRKEQRTCIGTNFKSLLLLVSVGTAICLCCCSGSWAGLSLDTGDWSAEVQVIGTEFYQATGFDEGIIRVFLSNTGRSAMSVKSCKLQTVSTHSDSQTPAEQILPAEYVYFRLDPTTILPGGVGELLIRFNRRPSAAHPLRCSILTSADQQITAEIAIEQPALRISYVGFSEDLAKIYVHLQNNSDRLMQVSLTRVNGFGPPTRDATADHELEPAGHTCLVFAPAFPLAHGQYVHVQVLGKSADSTVTANALTRAFGGFPICNTSGGGNPQLGLTPITTRSRDYSGPVCVYAMECMSHAHGSPAEAAHKLDNIRQSIISKDPQKLVYILFCWPRTDLRQFAPFFQLADLPVLNTCKNTYQDTTSAPPDYRDSFHQYLWRAQQALALSSPHPFAAVIPVGPNAKKSGFDDDLPSTDYIRFMTYCAIAGGAKGIYYRMDQDIEDPVRRREFTRLNKELQSLQPLLMISQPLAEAKTNEKDVYAGVLQCGQETLLVVLLNKAHPGVPTATRPPKPSVEQGSVRLTLQIPIPKGFTVQQVQDPYAPIPSSQCGFSDELLKLDYDMSESAQILRIQLTAAGQQNSFEGLAK